MALVPGMVLVPTAKHTQPPGVGLQVLALSPGGLPVTDPQGLLETETDFWEGCQSRRAILTKGLEAVTWHSTQGNRHGWSLGQNIVWFAAQMENILCSSRCLVISEDSEIQTLAPFLPELREAAYSAPLPQMAVVSLPLFPSGRPWPSWVPGLGWASLPPWPHSQASHPVSCLESDHRQPLPTHSLKGCPF